MGMLQVFMHEQKLSVSRSVAFFNIPPKIRICTSFDVVWTPIAFMSGLVVKNLVFADARLI